MDNRPPFDVSETSGKLGKLIANCWISKMAENKAKKISYFLIVVGAVIIVVSVPATFSKASTVLGLVGVMGLLVLAAGVAMLMDTLNAPPHVIAVYENGIIEARFSGIRYEVPWPKLLHVKFQEFFPHRYAEMQHIVDIQMPDRKKVRLRSTYEGNPSLVLETMKQNVKIEYETWEEVLKRTGG